MKKTISVVLSEEIHEKAKADAKAMGVSVSAYISILVANKRVKGGG